MTAPTDRSLDIAVAEALGARWIAAPSGVEHLFRGDEPGSLAMRRFGRVAAHDRLPHYSSDWSAALEIVEALAGAGIQVTLGICPDWASATAWPWGPNRPNEQIASVHNGGEPARAVPLALSRLVTTAEVRAALEAEAS